MNNMWISLLKTMNSLCINTATDLYNFVQLKNNFLLSFKPQGEQPVEQLVRKLAPQLLNKPKKLVHGARTVFEQLLKAPDLFKTTNVRSSALTPPCTSPKPLKHKRFFTLSTIY